MANYQPLELIKFPKKPTSETAEQKYWKSFRNVLLRQDHAAIVNVASSSDFYTCTSSNSVRFFNYQNSHEFSISRFRTLALGGCFRNDGELFTAGDIEGKVSIFQVNTKTLLRNYKHPKPAYAMTFWGDGNFITGCDDGNVRLWDLSQNKELEAWQGHNDYVRAIGTVGELAISGGMDGIIKLWDKRIGMVKEFNHNAPVSAVLGINDFLITAGHTNYKVWDLNQNKLLHTYSTHSKNITSISTDSHNTRLITSSLDGSVKIHNLKDFTVGHTIKYPSPVLSAKVTNENSHLVVGMADGKLSVRQHKNAKPKRKKKIEETDQIYLEKWEEYRKTAPTETVKDYKYFNRGVYSKPDGNEIQIEGQIKKKLKEYDVLLKKFRYSEVIDLAFELDRPELIITIIQELEQRDGLIAALKQREPQDIAKIIAWVAEKVNNPKYSHVVIPLANIVVDMYSAVSLINPEVKKELEELREAAAEEYKLKAESLEVIGMIDYLIND
ncbi:unnamed protein product [Blepharisma stoltei]|uniref:U3 small nucleolar RNA-associated protein 15 C-terminal domain-containing protein n=1 Tax=Blepharisma stoltei TaxID=1481888 RepID=A0AAU9JQZ2_9CILI|nr:unnamed protein product [Blepharisma stoltei]